jgi:ribosomal protein L7/L12
MSYLGLNKKVFDKMPKQEVELSKMEVELGLAQDLYNKFDSLTADVVNAEKMARQAANQVDSSASSVDTVIKSLKSVEVEFDKLIKTASDLGLDPKDAVRYKKQVSAYINEADELSKALKKASSMIFGILE